MGSRRFVLGDRWWKTSTESKCKHSRLSCSSGQLGTTACMDIHGFYIPTLSLRVPELWQAEWHEVAAWLMIETKATEALGGIWQPGLPHILVPMKPTTGHIPTGVTWGKRAVSQQSCFLPLGTSSPVLVKSKQAQIGCSYRPPTWTPVTVLNWFCYARHHATTILYKTTPSPQHPTCTQTPLWNN